MNGVDLKTIFLIQLLKLIPVILNGINNVLKEKIKKKVLKFFRTFSTKLG